MPAWIEAIWQDTRYAVRVMRKGPAFAALAVTTLALGIGVNTSSVAVAYGILVRPLPYADSSRIVIVNLLFADGGDLGFSPDTLQQWLPRLRTVDSAAGYYTRELTIRSAGRGHVVPATFVTDTFFDVLRTAPAYGHAPVKGDSGEVVISRRSLNAVVPGDPAQPVGAVISVSDKPVTIAGVMPGDFAFPDDETAIWVHSPALMRGIKPESSGYSKIVARLKAGVTLDQLRSDANRIRLELNPQSRETVSVQVLGDSIVGGLRKLLMIALAGGLMVLLVACANVATLFIGRDVARQRELAARMALGATAPQLVRAVLVETTLIALMASLLGVGLGAAALRLFIAEASGSISGLHRVAMGVPVIVPIAILTVAVTLICAAVPAWRAARADFSPFLRSSIVSRPRVWRVRSALVAAQIALSCVLLIGAGLLARTVSVLMHEDHGFEPDGALEAKIVLSDSVLFNGSAGQTFIRDLLDRVRAMPGVAHAGFGSNLPPRPPFITMSMRVVQDDRDETRFMKVGSASPDYLRALGAQFVSGRDFTEADNRTQARSVILSESAAHFLFPGRDAVGRTMSRLPAIFGIAGDPLVVGVVKDIKYEGLDAPASSALYLPWGRRPLGRGYLIVRASADPMRLAPDIRRTAQALDPAVPVAELQTLTAAMAQSVSNRRARALPAVGFGLLAVCVAFVGVLATLSTLVAERRRDFAIRSALGASPRRLTWTIVRQGISVTAVGLVVGTALGAAAARSLASLIYGISPYDATTFTASALAIGAGAILMAYVGALRLRGLDPLAVLRSE